MIHTKKKSKFNKKLPVVISHKDRIEFYRLARKRITENMLIKHPSRICLELQDLLRITGVKIQLQEVLKFFPELVPYKPASSPTVYVRWFMEIPSAERDNHRIKVLNEIILKMKNG